MAKKERRELKGLLRSKGLTYQEVSTDMEMGIATLSNKLNGVSDFDVGEMIRLARLLNLKSEDVGCYFFPELEHRDD